MPKLSWKTQRPGARRPPANFLERVFAAFIGIGLTALGLLFVVFVVFWLFLALLVSTIFSLLRGQRPAVAVFWQQWRDLSRHNPWRHAGRQAGPQKADDPPRPEQPEKQVQDVNWRDLPD